MGHHRQRGKRRRENRSADFRRAQALRILRLEFLEERHLLSTSDPFAQPTLVLDSIEPLSGTSSPGGITPSQMQQAYGFGQVTFSGGTVQGDGTGQTVAIVDAYSAPNITSDLAAFDSYFSL